MSDDSSLKAVGWARAQPLSHGVKAARDWARRHLDSLGWTKAAPDTAHAVLLAVSELVTNAHLHARSTALLVLVWDGEQLQLTVHDSSPLLPGPAALPDDDALGGRGMFLIDALADGWQARSGSTGKDVTVYFRVPPEATAPVSGP